MKHNATAHLILTIVLFVISTVVFGGSGPWGAIFGASVGMAGVVMGAQGGNLSGAASGAQKLLGVVVAIIINIVIYYALAVIIMFVFRLFVKKK